MCSTKALLVGDADEVALIKTYRSVAKGQGISTDSYGW
jgi:formate dehydrogenase iron-sulfur subunit